MPRSYGSAASPIFLRLLDFDDLGASERWQQEAEIVSTLSEHLLDDPAAAARDLIDLVRRQALPEQSDSLGLNREDLLARLNAAGISAIFPMPSRISKPERIFATPDLKSLTDAVLTGKSGWLVAHGDAGVGKTTTISALESRLPPGSTVVVYDCFGGGEYLSPAETRHLPQPALLQMINEIAVRCGTPMLVKPPDLIPLLWRRLEEVLAAAGEAAAAIGGRFVLAIDAVDNAVVAGRERSENSFVNDLLRLNPPPGVSILLSSRTHRLDDVGAPSNAEQIELRGFDLVASSKNLRGRFPEAADADCYEFHQRSRGNPRIQFYLLSPERAEAISTVEQAVADAHLTPRAYFEDLLNAAVGHVPDAARASTHLADLVHLTRPVKLETFARASGLSTTQARNFCRGLIPGVQLTENAIEFRDEDFETFLRDQVSAAAASAAHSRLADYFHTRRESDPEAAVALAEHLRAAGRDDDLITLTVDEGPPLTIKDPVVRIQTYFRRLELSMQVAERAKQRPYALRLAVLAAQAARIDQAVAAVVKGRPDLAMRFGDRQAVARIYEATYREPWRGPMHMRVAALYGQLGERAAAESQLRMAEAWIRRWSSLEKNERYNWEFDANDVAAAAQAVYWLEGPEAAVAWVRRWRPLDFVMEIGARLAAEVARVQSPRRVANQLARLELAALIEARILTELFTSGYRAPKAQVRRVAEALVDSPPREQRRQEPWTAVFAELVAAVTSDASLVLALLRDYGPPLPDHPPFAHSLGEWEEPLRLHCLRAAAEKRDADFEELLPVELRKDATKPEDHREAERRRERRQRFDIIERFQPFYARRARALLGNPSLGPASREIRAELEAYISATTHTWYRPDRTYATWARLAAETLAACRGDASQLLAAIAEAAPAVTTGSGAHAWLALGRFLVDRRRYRELALRLLDQVVVATEQAEEPAEERARQILDVAGLVAPHDADQASDYYRRAVVAAEGLDDEGAELLSVNARLGILCAAQDDPRHPALAERMARTVEGFRPFVTETANLPMTQTAEAATALDPPAGLALMSRWEDEDLLSLERSAPRVLAQAVRSAFLTPERGLALLHLGGESNFSAPSATAILDAVYAEGAPARSRIARATDQLSTFVRRDLLPDARTSIAPSLGRWFEEHGLADAPGGPELLALASFADQLNENEGRHRSSFGDTEEKKLIALERRAKNDGVAKMPIRLGEFTELWATGERIERYLLGVGRRIAPGKRLAALEALADLPADGEIWRNHSEALLRVLKGWLGEWRNSASVMDWVDRELGRTLEARVRWLFTYPEIADRALPFLMEMPGLADPAAVLLRALGPRLDQLRAYQLFALARGLAIPMEHTQQTDALEWSLALLEESEPPEPPTLPNKSSEAIADLLWALFGHPDKQVRWRAAHAARQMLSDGDPELGTALVERLKREDGGAFVSPDFEFLWISAQQWTAMVLARIADQAPQSLTGQSSTFAHLALDTEWPHAAVREFARRAALRLDLYEGLVLGEETRETLRCANRSVACLTKRGSHWDTRGGRYPGDDRRYQFDSLDVIPYWYEPLGNVFAMATAEISERAEHWIVDRLFFTQQTVDTARRERSERYEYEDLSRHQGSQPRVESLSSYLDTTQCCSRRAN